MRGTIMSPRNVSKWLAVSLECGGQAFLHGKVCAPASVMLIVALANFGAAVTAASTPPHELNESKAAEIISGNETWQKMFLPIQMQPDAMQPQLSSKQTAKRLAHLLGRRLIRHEDQSIPSNGVEVVSSIYEFSSNTNDGVSYSSSATYADAADRRIFTFGTSATSPYISYSAVDREINHCLPFKLFINWIQYSGFEIDNELPERPRAKGFSFPDLSPLDRPSPRIYGIEHIQYKRIIRKNDVSIKEQVMYDGSIKPESCVNAFVVITSIV